MSNFPLYDTLNCDIPSIDLTNKEKETFLKQVKLLDVDGIERLYVIIRIHQLENSEDKSSYIIPYKGKFVKTDIKFNLDDLPIDLKHMLSKFLKIHCKMMLENSTLHKEYENQVEVPRQDVEGRNNKIGDNLDANNTGKHEDNVCIVIKKTRKSRTTKKPKTEQHKATLLE